MNGLIALMVVAVTGGDIDLIDTRLRFAHYFECQQAVTAAKKEMPQAELACVDTVPLDPQYAAAAIQDAMRGRAYKRLMQQMQEQPKQ